MELKLNQVALWRRCGANELNTKAVAPGRTVRLPNAQTLTQTTEVCHRYAKDYMVGGQGFCLMVFCNNADAKNVEEQLDKIAKKIKKADAIRINLNATTMSFEYINFIIKKGNR